MLRRLIHSLSRRSWVIMLTLWIFLLTTRSQIHSMSRISLSIFPQMMQLLIAFHLQLWTLLLWITRGRALLLVRENDAELVVWHLNLLSFVLGSLNVVYCLVFVCRFFLQFQIYVIVSKRCIFSFLLWVSNKTLSSNRVRQLLDILPFYWLYFCSLCNESVALKGRIFLPSRALFNPKTSYITVLFFFFTFYFNLCHFY